MSPALVWDAVVVAGGGGHRLGGAVKADLDLGAGRLLDGILTACRSARAVVVVGDVAVPDGVRVTREDPPGGGPAAGVVAGLSELADDPAPWVMLLACDLPGATAGVPRLLEAAGAAATDVSDPDVSDTDGNHPLDEAPEGICLAAPDGHAQWLFGIHRRGALDAAVAVLGTGQDRSMKALLGPLTLATVPAPWEAVGDVDTWEDARRWRHHLSPGSHS